MNSDIKEYKLILKDNSEFTIPVRMDGYVNATILCKAGNKQFHNWYQNKSTKNLIVALENVCGISRTLSIDIKQGGISNLQGSWIHPDLAIQCAQWVSPHFAIQVSGWIRELRITDSNLKKHLDLV